MLRMEEEVIGLGCVEVRSLEFSQREKGDMWSEAVCWSALRAQMRQEALHF